MDAYLPYVLGVLATVVVLFAARKLFIAGPSAPRVNLTGKTMLVTGASVGSIGFDTARLLAEQGARVVITTRSAPERALAALRAKLSTDAKTRVSALSLDLSLAESVRDFEAALSASIGDTLDVLVNNAGVHLDLANDWKAPHLTKDGHEIQWRTNYLGTSHLTALLMPMLVRAASARGEARVVNVVSGLHRLAKNEELFAATRPYNSWRAYGRSKLALVHATREIERKHGARDNVHAYCLHPGSVYSKVADKGLEGKRLIGFVRTVFAPFEAFFLRTTSEGAQTTVLCATGQGLVGGAYYESCRVADPSSEASDGDVSARLADETQAWCATLR